MTELYPVQQKEISLEALSLGTPVNLLLILHRWQRKESYSSVVSRSSLDL